MIRIVKFAALAALCLGLAAAPAYGAKGNGGAGGGSKATISFAGTGSAAAMSPTAGSSVTFAVTASVKPSDVYSLWVANVCSLDGVTVSAEYLAVKNWLAGPFTVSAAGTRCTAFVWMFPDAWTPLPGATLTYAVTG